MILTVVFIRINKYLYKYNPFINSIKIPFFSN